jgi:hypothetical protein
MSSSPPEPHFEDVHVFGTTRPSFPKISQFNGRDSGWLAVRPIGSNPAHGLRTTS